jgi:dTDP-4-dehydrorhamnose reductase
MKRILITGAQGQLGQELQKILAPLGDVTAAGRDVLDLAQPETIRQVMATVQPAIVVNAAAYTAVDKAESDAEAAYACNKAGTGILAQEAKALGATLIHVSTDYVFDGTQSTPYLETDATNPIGVYGQSKRAGEQAIEAAGGHHIILRTAWVYGVGGKGNFVKTMLRLGVDREELRVVSDQVGSPTWTGDLARAIAQLISQLSPDIHGIYHYTNSGVASWYDFAVAIFEEGKSLGFPLKIQTVKPISTAEYPTPARRPAYSVLSCAKIAAVLGSHPPHWRTALKKMLLELSTSL